jgi:magnesium transporter
VLVASRLVRSSGSAYSSLRRPDRLRYARRTVLTCRLYRDGKLEKEGFHPSEVSDLLAEEGTLQWVDAEDPSDEELETLQEEFSLHPLALEDVRHREQRPKVDVYEDHFYLVLYGLTWDEDAVQTHEMHIFVGRGFLLTIRYPPPFDLAGVQRRWQRQEQLTSEGGGFLLYALLDEVVDGYLEAVDRFEDLSESIEEIVFSEPSESDVQAKIFDVRRKLVKFRRLVLPLRDVLDLVQEELGVVTEPLRAYYRDVADHVLRTLGFIDAVRELVTAALEAHMSQVGNRLNVVMKRVTSWGAILLVPSLIAGYFGMNFQNVGGLLSSWGWLWSLLLMGGSMFALHRLFRRIDWL